MSLLTLLTTHQVSHGNLSSYIPPKLVGDKRLVEATRENSFEKPTMSASQRRHSSAAAQSVRAAINTAVYRSIAEDQNQIDPPKLSPELWDYVSIQAPENKAESERLEFLGDALMDACIAIELYKAFPDGTPHKYTVCNGRFVSYRYQS